MQANSFDKDLLATGRPPLDDELLDWLTVGTQVWENFAVSEYLDRYIAEGGSQFKVIVGKPGSGKTHLLRRLKSAAEARNYIVAYFEASSVRLNRIDSLYRTIVGHIEVDQLTTRLAEKVIQQMGYESAEMSPGRTFVEWLVDQGRFRERVVREIQENLERFFKQREIDTGLCLAYIQLAADHLGAQPLGDENRRRLYDWIRGERLTASELRTLLLTRLVDRYSARELLDSISRLLRDLGFRGLIVLIDGLEDLLGRDPETGRTKYTRTGLNDVYQSLREFIDATPFLTSVWLITAGRRELLDDIGRGIKSYDALWLRLQHEIMGRRNFNRFGQIVDLDQASELLLSDEESTQLFRLIQEVLGMQEPSVVTEDLLSPYGDTGRFRKTVLGARQVGR